MSPITAAKAAEGFIAFMKAAFGARLASGASVAAALTAVAAAFFAGAFGAGAFVAAVFFAVAIWMFSISVGGCLGAGTCSEQWSSLRLRAAGWYCQPQRLKRRFQRESAQVRPVLPPIVAASHRVLPSKVDRSRVWARNGVP